MASESSRPYWQRRARALILGFTVAVLIAVGALESFDLWWRYDRALRQAEARAQNDALVLAEYVRGSLYVADTSLRQLAVHGSRIGGAAAPHSSWDSILDAARASMPVGRSGSISVADSTGVITHSTMRALVGQSRSDHYIFQHLSTAGRDELTMDWPFLVPQAKTASATTPARYILPLGRRLTSASGGFDGVIVTTYEIEGFLQLFSKVDVGPHGVVSVFHPDGVLVFRVPATATPGQPLQADPLMQASRQAERGVLVGPVPSFAAPGETYISAFNTLSTPPPLVVAVSLSRSDVLSEWRDHLRTSLLALGALAVTLGAIVLVLFRQMAARQHAESAMTQLRLEEATRLRGANEQLEAALEREQRARRDAEAASRLKDEFLMTLSHELRTPLTAIYGWVRMLSTNILPEGERGRALAAVERNAQAQTRLIDDLLDVSRAISGKLRLEPKPLHVPEIVRAAIDTVAPALEAKGIHLDLQADDDMPMILADPDRVQQIVWNLLSNAIKFTPSEGTIRVGVAQAGDGVEIVVSDSGIGIHPDFVPYVFERFRQADVGTRRRYGGLGLGLAIVRHLVELHGGSVRAESGGDERGATFRIVLPSRAARRDSRPDQPVAATRITRNAGARLDGIRVLVVDDEPDARELFTSIVQRAGATASSAASAAEALAAMAAAPPQVLLSDIEMPGQDGFQLLQLARAQSAGHAFIAIAVTAYARPVDKRRAIDAGFDWHLAKPVDPGDLLAVIASLLAPAHAR